MAAVKNLGSEMASSGNEASDNRNDDTAPSLDEGDFVKLFSAISVPYIQVRVRLHLSFSSPTFKLHV